MQNVVVDIEFYRTRAGARPAHDWLRSLPKADRKFIGDDIRRIEEKLPIEMPTCKPVQNRKCVRELRTRTERLRSTRILFSMENGYALLLHSPIRKENKTPPQMFENADRRLADYHKPCNLRKLRRARTRRIS